MYAPHPQEHGKLSEPPFLVNSSVDLPVPNDCFALLGVARRPWIEPDVLKERFQGLASVRHPDTLHGDTMAFTDLNAAYRTLADPVKRLAHFLALEFPETCLAKSAPSELAELFLRIGSAVQRVNGFLVRRKEARGPLGQALLAGEGARFSEEVRSLRSLLTDEQQHRWRALQILDAHWEARPDDAAARLSAWHTDLAFLSKWSDELRERSLRLLESPAVET